MLAELRFKLATPVLTARVATDNIGVDSYIEHVFKIF